MVKTRKGDWINLYDYIVDNIGLNAFEKKSKQYNVTIDVDPISFI